MKRINDLKIDIYADGANLDSILELNKNPLIKGFTTNPTLMKKAGINNYKKFAIEILHLIKEKPISFEVFADDFDEMIDQAQEISSWGKNVNIKIPVINTKGKYTSSVINYLSSNNISCNITAVFNIKQFQTIFDEIHPDTPAIISIFAGRIADSGLDPIPIMKEAVFLSKGKKNVKILWASPREILNIFQAEESGTHIITVANDLLSKFNNIGKNLEKFSLETVNMFYNDAKFAGYKIDKIKNT